MRMDELSLPRMVSGILSKVESEATVKLGELGFSDPGCALRNLKALDKGPLSGSLDPILERDRKSVV